jgi:molecular chaperone DnaJ
VTAAIGGDVDVPTPDGLATLKIPAGTPNGKLFRMRGKGMPSLRGLGTGDLVARIVFEVPQRLTAKQRGLLDDLAKTLEPTNFPDAQRLASAAKTFYARKEKLAKVEK